MTILKDIIYNKAIYVPVTAWFLAQLIKVIVYMIKNRRFDFSRFVGSGGMPSSHSSFIVALATVIGLNLGFDSYEFAIAISVALIVMYDASGVRRSAGKHAEILNQLLHLFDTNIRPQKKLKELLGHSPIEVLMGAILGIFVGTVLG